MSYGRHTDGSVSCRHCGRWIKRGWVVSGGPFTDCGPYCTKRCMRARNEKTTQGIRWDSSEDWP